MVCVEVATPIIASFSQSFNAFYGFVQNNVYPRSTDNFHMGLWWWWWCSPFLICCQCNLKPCRLLYWCPRHYIIWLCMRVAVEERKKSTFCKNIILQSSSFVLLNTCHRIGVGVNKTSDVGRLSCRNSFFLDFLSAPHTHTHSIIVTQYIIVWFKFGGVLFPFSLLQKDRICKERKGKSGADDALLGRYSCGFLDSFQWWWVLLVEFYAKW